MPPGHFQFNYKFSDTEGISFGDLPYIDIHGDLLIYYDSLSGDDFVDCWCSRWDVNNYTIIVETILKEEDAYNIIDNTVPGAVGELYEILGRKHYYDMTWNKENTLRLVPHSCTRYTRATQSFS